MSLDPNIVSIVTKARQEAKQQSPEPAAKKIEITHFDDIHLDTECQDVIEDFIPKSSLVVVWGPPKEGKSFWVFDLLMHVPRGLEYHGRFVQQGAVVYCAFEGQVGISRRIAAYRQKRLDDGESAGPFYLQTTTLDLINDHPALIEAIKQKLGTQVPAVIALDTLNRSLVGSESSDQDMAAYIRAAGAIIEAFGCAVIIVHHCGHARERMRGHSSLIGAEDVEIAVKRIDRDGKVSQAEVLRMKDGAEGARITFRLETVTVGQNKRGKDITSCVVEVIDATSEASTEKPVKPLSDNQRLAMEALDAALIDHGKSGHIADAPFGTRHVHGDHWKAELFRRGVLDKDHSNTRQAFTRLWQGMARRHLIEQRDGSFWRVPGHGGVTP
jgi:hypothetical protein